jgi:hypothetical protein
MKDSGVNTYKRSSWNLANITGQYAQGIKVFARQFKAWPGYLCGTFRV